MARKIDVLVLDGKENTIDATIVVYQIGIPSDVLFYTSNGITYASFWDMAIPPNVVSIPVTQIISID